MTFGIPFSINFPDRLNLVICSRYNAKTSFLEFQASHFGIKNRSTNHLFSKPLLGPPFSHVFSIFFKNGRFVDPLHNLMRFKMVPKSTKWRQNSEKFLWRMLLWAVAFQTLFSRNHSNSRAVGTSWLLKGHLFYGDWLMFCFCCVSLCSVL